MIDDTAGSAAEQLSALRALVADGRGELAVIRLRRLLQGEPRSIEAQALLASTLLSLHQPEEALRSADAVVAAEPNNPEGHHLRARVLLQLGQASPALAASEAAVDREPLVPAAAPPDEDDRRLLIAGGAVLVVTAIAGVIAWRRKR